MRLAVYFKENLDKIRIYICGTSKYMPQAVKKSLLEVFSIIGGSEAEGIQLYNKLESRRQIVFETW